MEINTFPIYHNCQYQVHILCMQVKFENKGTGKAISGAFISLPGQACLGRWTGFPNSYLNQYLFITTIVVKTINRYRVKAKSYISFVRH